MDRKVIWSEPAIDGLGGIVRHIAEDNRTAAFEIGRLLMDRMEITLSFPQIGPLYRKMDDVEIRCLTEGNYRLYYRIGKEPRRDIEVVAVRHSAREQPVF